MPKTDTVVELFYGGTWNDITATDDVYTRDPITITRGRPDESQRIPPSTLSLTIENRDGKYSPRNPMSPLFGLIGRNTPIRVSAPSVRDTFTRTTASGWGTPDLGPPWTTSGGSASDYSVSFGTGRISHGSINVGRGAIISYPAVDQFYYGEWTLPVVPTGAQVRSYVHMRRADSANYYYAFIEVSASGPGTVNLQVGKVVGGSSSGLNTALAVGTHSAGNTWSIRAEAVGSTIRMKAWKVGTTEPTNWQASATDTTFTTGSTLKLDSLMFSGNTNTLPVVMTWDNVKINSYRVTAEVESWPQRWSVGGDDVWAPITANGITRRLNAPGTTKPAPSPLRRTLSTATYAGLLGWWPLEDAGPDVTSAPSALIGGAPMLITDTAVTRSLDDTLPGATTLPKSTISVGASNGTTLYGGSLAESYVPLLPSTGNSWSMLFWFRTRLVQDTPTTTTIIVQAKIAGSPQIDRWMFFITPDNVIPATPRITVNVFAVDAAGGFVTGLSPAAVDMPYTDGVQGWHSIRFNADVSGGNHRMRVWLDETLAVTSTESAGKTVGQPSQTNVRANTFKTVVPTSFGQILFAGGTGGDVINTNAAQLISAGKAYANETAADRVTRLCAEAGISATIVGDGASTERVGVQKAAPLLDLLQDAADADGGILYEPREILGLAYRTRTDLYNQAPTVTLNYTAGDEVAPPLEPVEDTDVTTNDVTVTRYLGGQANVVQATGPLNVQEPGTDPNGVGRYPKDITLVLANDGQCLQAAAWLKHLGTWDEARYPVVAFDLTALAQAGKTALLAAAADVNIGDRVSITNPPPWVPPDSIEQRAQGFTETLESHHWTITANATPALPYDVLRLETDTTSNLSRIPTASSSVVRGMVLPGTSGNYLSTPDNAALDITGDIDLRVDMTLADWTPAVTAALVSKWGAAPNRSYLLNLTTTGALQLAWSADGTNAISRTSTIAVPLDRGRLVVRATLDVNNGAAGHDVAFYTGPTLDGPWTQLGSTVTTGGTTSIFSGNLPVEVGSHTGGTSSLLAGTVHGVQIHNLINGTLVANPLVDAQATGTTTFADGVGRTWTRQGTAAIYGNPNTTDTAILVASPGTAWIDSAGYGSQFPFDVMINGERMRVTAITGTGPPQVFTVTRSINTVVKTHTAGVSVQLFRPPRIAR